MDEKATRPDVIDAAFDVDHQWVHMPIAAYEDILAERDELLAALKALLREYDLLQALVIARSGSGTETAAQQIARVVLAKAEGLQR